MMVGFVLYNKLQKIRIDVCQGRFTFPTDEVGAWWLHSHKQEFIISVGYASLEYEIDILREKAE